MQKGEVAKVAQHTPAAIRIQPNLMRSCSMQGIYRYLNLAGIPESTFLVGCYEAKDGKGTA
jgi:hypothetical protein